MVLLVLFLRGALAQPPSDLDGLVELALTRDPSATALAFDASAARSRARSAVVPMDPQLMIGVDALGAPMDAADPTMGMVAVTQMFRGVGEGRALARRTELDATRAEADRVRLAADVRVRLWQTVARIGTLKAEAGLVDEQLESVEALRQIAFARYASGAVVEGMGAMSDMSAMAPMDGGGTDMGVRPPLVVPRGGGMGGMAGMGNMGGGTASRTVLVETDMGAMSGAPRSEAPPPPTGGLAFVLDLDARIARVGADRMALGAELESELAVLALLVGEEAAAAVAANPDAYLGSAVGEPPELALASIDREAALADLHLQRIGRRPDLMVSVAERFMPDDMWMPAGTDVSVGIEVPLWGSRGRLVDAARAEVGAAEARLAAVERDLAIAAAQAKAELTVARARSDALERVALPRAKTAWDASLAAYAAGSSGPTDVVRAWENWISVGRDAVAARRELELRAAVLARVEGT